MIRCQAAMCSLFAVALVITPGCGSNDFLGLEDYQRDFLLGGLAAALLTQQAGNGAADGEPGAPLPGRDGADGVSCWDLNGNGEGDPAEDINGDGAFDGSDCQGTAGQAGSSGTSGVSGAVGPAGADGQDGADGLHCWDLDGDGVGDLNEDANGDGDYNTLDCQGAPGETGPAGANGSNGAPGAAGNDGPEFFDIFIDDFFKRDRLDPLGDLTVRYVSIAEPVLGAWNGEMQTPTGVGYRMAIPDTYWTGNPVTMRLFLHRTGSFEEGCFVFTVDASRLRAGSDIEAYGPTRWVRVDGGEGSGTSAGRVTASDMLIVVDLPVNTTPGLGYANDLAGGDFLAFELNTDWMDGFEYHLLGVEFFESGDASLEGATLFTSKEDVRCFVDCNDNGMSDDVDIAEGTSEDCNENDVPDECELEENDCDANGIPDDCDGGRTGCCSDADCDDGDTCTVDYCDGECYNYDKCECRSDEDCDDGIDCTEDWCSEGTCMNYDSGCRLCLRDSDCEDEDACTINQCAGNYCNFVPLECPVDYVCVNGECVD